MYIPPPRESMTLPKLIATVPQIVFAYEQMREIHRNLYRMNQEESYIHPEAVATYLLPLELGDDFYAACLLHEAFRNGVGELELRRNYGVTIMNLVMAVTFDVANEARRWRGLSLFESAKEDWRILFLYGGNRHHNLRTMRSLSDEVVFMYATETLSTYRAWLPLWLTVTREDHRRLLKDLWEANFAYARARLISLGESRLKQAENLFPSSIADICIAQSSHPHLFYMAA